MEVELQQCLPRGIGTGSQCPPLGIGYADIASLERAVGVQLLRQARNGRQLRPPVGKRALEQCGLEPGRREHLPRIAQRPFERGR